MTKAKDVFLFIVIFVVANVIYVHSDYYISDKQEQYLEYMAGDRPNLTEYSRSTGFAAVSVEYGKYNEDRELYPPLGHMFVSKILHQNIKSFYKNCKSYPDESLFWEILNENGDCYYNEQTGYEKELVSLFKNKKTKIENVIIDIVKNENDIDYSLLILHVEQKPIRETYFSGDFEFGDLFRRFDMIDSGLFYSIMCKKEECIFFDITRFLYGKAVEEVKSIKDHYYCHNYSKMNPKKSKEYCELIKNQWPNLRNRILKHIKD